MAEQETGVAYEMVIADLDGTLLAADGELAERTRIVIKQVLQSGLRVTLATARSSVDALRYARTLGLTEPLICQNGAVLFSAELNVALDRYLLASRVVADVVARVRRLSPQATLAIDYPFDRLADPDWRGPDGGGRCQLTLWPLSSDEIPKRRAATVLVRDLPEPTALAWEGLPVTVTSSSVGLTEISRAGIDKGTGLRRICRRLGVDPAGVIAFGDMPNDTSLLVNSGMGVAMGNAWDELKEVADVVAPPNTQDGVAAVLHAMLSGTLSLRER